MKKCCDNCANCIPHNPFIPVCEECVFVLTADGKIPSNWKPFHKTNADRIRAMTDEELAEWIARTQIGAIKDAMTILRLPYDEGDKIVELGKTEALEWLQQPAEGDA